MVRTVVRRGLLALAGLLAIVAAAAVFLAIRTWESPALTRAVLDALSSPELRVEAATVRLSLLRGVELAGLVVDGRIPDGRLRATAESALLHHRPLRLLDGEILVEEIVLRRADAEIVWDAAAAPREAPGAAAGAPRVAPEAAAGAATAEAGWTLTTRVERFAVEGGGLVMREAGVDGEMLRVEGLDLTLRELTLPPGDGAPLVRVAGAGELAAETLATAAFAARGVTAGLRMAGGHLLVADLALPTELGPIAVESVDLDLGRDPYVYVLTGTATPLDTNRLLSAKAGFGAGTLTFALDGDGSEAGGPRGGGELRVAEGTLGALPLLTSVERLLAGTDIVGRPYATFAVPYRLDGDLLTVQPFAVVAGNLALAGSGTVDLAGPLDLRLEVSLPREDVAVKEIPAEVLEALTDVDGRVKLPIVLGGSLAAPSASFDRRAWAGLARRRLADEAGRRLGDALRRRLSGDRD